MQATAPYNFVPVSSTVVFPSWGEIVSQDVPFADGLCGHLDLEILAHTPLFIRGLEENGGFFETPDGNPALPGTSLRGMLRNVVQIASFGKLGPVNDHCFGVRDLDLKAYTKKMADQSGGARFPLVNAGWLSLDNRRAYEAEGEDGSARWTIQPCHFAKVHYDFLSQIAGAAGKSCYAAVPKTSARAKYEEWQEAGLKLAQTCVVTKVAPASAPKNWVRPRSRGDYGQVSKVNPATGGVAGHFVFTGQPAPWPAKPKAKHHEFFFHGSAGDPLEVSWGLRQQFEFIHSRVSEQRGSRDQTANEEWAFMRSELTREGARASIFGGKGVPVFFLLDAHGNLEAFGLAMMFRLASTRTTGGVIRYAQPSSTDMRLDLAEAIFGRVRKDGAVTSALRGRVSLETAVATGPTPRLDAVEGVLGAPRASYYPNYIEQETVAPGQDSRPPYRTYLDEDSRARGWKRFPTRRKVVPLPRPPMNEAGEVNREVLSSFQPLAPGARFTTRLHFHNLRRVELGAVLWALDFGGRPEARHGLGLAKPYGYGSVAIRVTGERLVANDVRASEAPLLSVLRDEFRAFMEREIPSGWESSDQIYQLISMALPPADDAQLRKLRPMRLEPNEFRLAKQAQGAPLPPYGTPEGLEAHQRHCSLNPPPTPSFLPPTSKPPMSNSYEASSKNLSGETLSAPRRAPIQAEPQVSDFDQKLDLVRSLGSNIAGQAGPHLEWYASLQSPKQRRAAAECLVNAMGLKSVKRKAREGSEPWAAVLSEYSAPKR